MCLWKGTWSEIARHWLVQLILCHCYNTTNGALNKSYQCLYKVEDKKYKLRREMFSLLVIWKMGTERLHTQSSVHCSWDIFTSDVNTKTDFVVTCPFATAVMLIVTFQPYLFDILPVALIYLHSIGFLQVSGLSCLVQSLKAELTGCISWAQVLQTQNQPVCWITAWLDRWSSTAQGSSEVNLGGGEEGKSCLNWACTGEGGGERRFGRATALLGTEEVSHDSGRE